MYHLIGNLFDNLVQANALNEPGCLIVFYSGGKTGWSEFRTARKILHKVTGREREDDAIWDSWRFLGVKEERKKERKKESAPNKLNGRIERS